VKPRLIKETPNVNKCKPSGKNTSSFPNSVESTVNDISEVNKKICNNSKYGQCLEQEDETLFNSLKSCKSVSVEYLLQF